MNANVFMTAGSCDVGKMPQPKPAKSELELSAEKLGITPAKLQSMREYVVLLRKSDRKMKMSTVRRKVLEKYKIKLV